MTDKDYWGDEDSDCDDGMTSVSRSSDSSSSHPPTGTSVSKQFFVDLPHRRKHKRQVPRFVKEESLRDMPRRRSRRCIPHFVAVSASSEEDTVSKPITSHYYSSRWLNEYFLSQHKFLCIERSRKDTPTPTVVVEKDVYDETCLAKARQEVPLKTSCHSILVDDAISFSLLPRVLIEADAPHRVVHTNAAYARRYGSSQTVTSNRFDAPHVENHHDLEVAVASLFDALDSLVMYPVCEYITEMKGEVSVSVVTHYLIEAGACIPLVGTVMNATNLICIPDVRPHRWRATPAHAIA